MSKHIQLTDAVTYEVRGNFAIVTIDRPQQRNAVNSAVATGIESGIDLIEDDDDIRVGVLAGTPPAFCAGADLKEIARGSGALLGTERGGFAGFVRRERTKPIIASVEGPALAGGTEIALACDLVVASRSATFGIPEVKRSLVAAAGGLFRLGRKIPLNVAMECALTGDPMDAETAQRHGLVNVLVEDGKALAGSFELADRICANAPVAVHASRHVVLIGTHAPDEVGWDLSAEASARATASADFTEGLSAFIEKRSPKWMGR